MRSSSEQEEEKIKAIQKFEFLVTRFPQNVALKKIAQKRMLDAADLTPEEIREVLEEEERVPELPAEVPGLEAMSRMPVAPRQQALPTALPAAQPPGNA